MAQTVTLEGLRSQILTSIFGRRLGLSAGNGNDTAVEYLTGPRAFRSPVVDMTTLGSTSADKGTTAIAPYGVTLVSGMGTSGSSGTLMEPVPGVEKIIICPPLSSVASFVVHANSGGFVSSGARSTAITMLNGSWVKLMGVSTIDYLVTGKFSVSTGGSSYVTFS